MSNYFIYDGRANYDIESACVMECFEADNDKQAKKYVKKNWSGHDTVLCDQQDNIVY